MLHITQQPKITVEDLESRIKQLKLSDKTKVLAILKRYKQIKQIEEEMNAATKKVKKKYIAKDKPVLKNMSAIVSGQKAIEMSELKDLQRYLNEDEIKQANENLGAQKIPGYWAKVLLASGMVRPFIEPHDQQLLEYVEDIHVVDEEGSDDFTIVFVMRENDIIANKELTKRFYIVDGSPTKCDSSPTEWKGKDLTKKEVKKKQKNKKTGEERVVVKYVEKKSLFNFFRSIDQVSLDSCPMEGDVDALYRMRNMQEDFELGGIIGDEIIPYSFEYYLGIEHKGDGEEGDKDIQIDEEGNEEEEEDAGKDGFAENGKKKIKS